MWETVCRFVEEGRRSGFFDRQRARQSRDWMQQLIRDMLLARLRDSAAVRRELPDLEAAVEAQRTTPYAAARRVLELLDAGDGSG